MHSPLTIALLANSNRCEKCLRITSANLPVGMNALEKFKTAEIAEWEMSLGCQNNAQCHCRPSSSKQITLLFCIFASVTREETKMVSFDKIPDLVGFLVLTEDGAVLESGGELKNDERSANVVTSLINLTETYDAQSSV